MTWAQAIARVLRDWRRHAELRPCDVAKRAGISSGSYSHHESGQHAQSIDALDRIARTYGHDTRASNIVEDALDLIDAANQVKS